MKKSNTPPKPHKNPNITALHQLKKARLVFMFHVVSKLDLTHEASKLHCHLLVNRVTALQNGVSCLYGESHHGQNSHHVCIIDIFKVEKKSLKLIFNLFVFYII